MNKVIVALDNMNKEELLSFLNLHHKQLRVVKIGLELYTRFGRSLIEQVTDLYPELEVFLDLKYHDIPSTVAKSIASLQGLRIKFLTIHLSGGESMIKEALISRDSSIPMCKILGVSILTSLTTKEITQIWNRTKQEIFHDLYQLAQETKIDGIICSGHELADAKKLDETSTHNPIKICPGIRFIGDSKDDQNRVMTPKEALERGADYLVIGRSITKNPKSLLQLDKKLSE